MLVGFSRYPHSSHSAGFTKHSPGNVARSGAEISLEVKAFQDSSETIDAPACDLLHFEANDGTKFEEARLYKCRTAS